MGKEQPANILIFFFTFIFFPPIDYFLWLTKLQTGVNSLLPLPRYLCDAVIFNRGYKGRKHYRKLADSKERKKEKVSLHQAPDAGAGEGILVQYVLDP